MNPPTQSAPIGYFLTPDNRKISVFAERWWYQYWAVELYSRVGGPNAPDNNRLAQMIAPVLFDEQDGSEEVFFIPQQPQAAPAQPAAQTIIFWDETLQDEPMFARA